MDAPTPAGTLFGMTATDFGTLLAALATPDDLAKYIRQAHAEGRGVLFGLGGESDFKDSSQVIAYAVQDGLGLPEKSYYAGDEHKAEREAYQAHIEATLKLAGADEATAKAQAAGFANLGYEQASFEPLPERYRDMDVIFGVETLCYAQDLDAVARSVAAALRPLSGPCAAQPAWHSGAGAQCQSSPAPPSLWPCLQSGLLWQSGKWPWREFFCMEQHPTWRCVRGSASLTHIKFCAMIAQIA